MNQEVIFQDEQSIKNRFENDSVYTSQAEESRVQYNTQLQIAKYSVFPPSIKYGIINAGQISTGQTVFYVLGSVQPTHQLEFKQFMAYFTLLVDQHISSGFIVFYFNTGLLTHINLSEFFQAYKKLPLEYYTKLQRFYIMHGNIFVKSWIWFDNTVQITVLKQKVEYLQKLLTLDSFKFYNLSLYGFLPASVLAADASHQVLKELLAVKDNNSECTSAKTETTVAYRDIIEVDIQEFDLNSLGIPICLDMLVSFLDNNTQYLQQEGFFRKNATVSDEKQLELLLINNQYDQIVFVKDQYATAGVIKKIFNKMPNPLVPFTYYEELVTEIPKLELHDQLNLLRQTMKQIPDLNYKVFVFLIGFLLRVTEFKDQNKMTTYNMAVVFGPCFFRPLEYSISDIKNAGVVVKIYQLMMDNFDLVFEGEQYQDMLTEHKKLQDSSEIS